MQKPTSKSIVINLLENLFDIAGDILDLSISRKGAYRQLNRLLGHDSYSKELFTKRLNNLKQSGYISLNSQSIVLTNKAKMKIVDKLVSQFPRDNKYYLISFDIPESLRICRNKFRRFIKKLGFVQIQKSLWATDRNVGDLVEMASQEFKVGEYIAYFVSIKSNIDQLIKQKLT